jgi:hypothetical protein
MQGMVRLVTLFLLFSCSSFQVSSEKVGLLRNKILAVEAASDGAANVLASEVTLELLDASDAVLDTAVSDAVIKMLLVDDLEENRYLVAEVLTWISVAGARLDSTTTALTNLILRLDQLQPPSDEEGLLRAHPNLAGRACDALAFVTMVSSTAVGQCAKRSSYWPTNPWEDRRRANVAAGRAVND